MNYNYVSNSTNEILTGGKKSFFLKPKRFIHLILLFLIGLTFLCGFWNHGQWFFTGILILMYILTV